MHILIITILSILLYPNLASGQYEKDDYVKIPRKEYEYLVSSTTSSNKNKDKIKEKITDEVKYFPKENIPNLPWIKYSQADEITSFKRELITLKDLAENIDI